MKLIKLLQSACIFFLIVAGGACSKKQSTETSQRVQPEIQTPTNFIEGTYEETGMLVSGEFDIPELYIHRSPQEAKIFSFKNDEMIRDYDVSPSAPMVAVLVEQSETLSIAFWSINDNAIVDQYRFPLEFKATSLAWHPTGNSIFVVGQQEGKYYVIRVDKLENEWKSRIIFTSSNELIRLVVCPRPFVIDYDQRSRKQVYNYRLFLGMDNGDKTFRIVSITESGKRFYQVVGPSKTFTNGMDFNEDMDPSNIEATYALPVAFHPAGHQLIWEDKNNRFSVANYEGRWWGKSKPIDVTIKNLGTLTPTPNGLGFINWQKGKSGIGMYLHSSKKEENQLADIEFLSRPLSVPDGKGIVGLTKNHSITYSPIDIPLADVANAWMFAETNEEVELLRKHQGLFRPNHSDQLYKLYETENYHCSSYDRNSPTRPYLVTTDIFWELYAAAYQGLFIVKERDEAIPNFWKFIDEAHKYFSKQKNSPWTPVFAALNDFKDGNKNNEEAKRIIEETQSYSETLNRKFNYSTLKPRGHYTSKPEMVSYFKAFKYFTTIYEDDQEILKELGTLPNDIQAIAENWIKTYSGFISPSRSPLVWNNMKQSIPSYCQYPKKELSVFPLSWGFDNEILNSTIFRLEAPSDLQVRGPKGERMLPSGIDMAAVFGNSLADKLLQSDYEKYPPLRKVIDVLRKNLDANKEDLKQTVYAKWINAVAVQWADTVNSTNGGQDKMIWQAKRLQTGLATWATLRHATVLVNATSAAECGEAGFEEILMRAPRGYVEPDPYTFGAIADLFESTIKFIDESLSEKTNMNNDQRALYEGILKRLEEAAQDAREFKRMAEKVRRGEMLNNEENLKVLYVARTAEHLFLIFNSLANNDYGLANPEPIAKIAEVSGEKFGPYLMVAVGNAMEWNHIVPFYGRRQIVKGSIYSYYEFPSNQLMNDPEWREKVSKQEVLPWIKPFVIHRQVTGMAKTRY
jgi:hypothetical protein